ncbi:MAG: type II secretion system F family protein [Gammaproteobacteria bacterium]|nr:type II secretion system F family protein [Gammaproteobacteria bacterium]
MTTFIYKALDSNGKKLKSTINADSTKQATSLLRDKGLIPIDVKIYYASDKNFLGNLFSTNNHLKLKDLSAISRQLAVLIKARVPLTDVLATLIEQLDKAAHKEILTNIRNLVLEGQSLAHAMGNYPKSFPKIYVATIASGEKSGNLGEVLTKLADFTEAEYYNRQKTQQALIYPAIMTIFSIAIVSFLLVYVVPKLVAVFKQTNQILPLATRILLQLSYYLQHFGLYFLLLLLLGLIIFRKMLQKDSFRYSYHTFLLKIPALKLVLRISNIASFSRAFSIMVAASVPVVEAMVSANKLLTLLPISRALQLAVEQVRSGRALSLALKESAQFDPIAISLIAAGESSGELANMLERAANNEERNLNLFLDKALRLFEPILIMTMGLVVLFIVLAILLPIFSLDQLAG